MAYRMGEGTRTIKGLIMSDRCEIPGCRKKALYALYWQLKEQKVWIHVCDFHERKLGDKNKKGVKV